MGEKCWGEKEESWKDKFFLHFWSYWGLFQSPLRSDPIGRSTDDFFDTNMTIGITLFDN